MNIGAALTRKIGPLPAWGWGVALGGAIVAARMLRGGGGGGDAGAKPVVVSVPTGSPMGMGEDFASDLGNQLDQLRRENDDRWEDLSDNWDDRFDDLWDAVDTIQTPITNTPNPGGSINPIPAPQPKPGIISPPTDLRVQEILREVGYWVSENRVPDYARVSEAEVRAYAQRQVNKPGPAPGSGL